MPEKYSKIFKRLFKNEKENNKSTICVLPWLSLNLNQNNTVYHCCLTSDPGVVAGDLSKQTIAEIWNGSYMKSIRKDMINGKETALCSHCYELEHLSEKSVRLTYNNHFRSKLKEIPFITDNDGSTEKIDLKYLDIRFSNICNYKCRICNSWASTSWINDDLKLGRNYNVSTEKPTKITSIDQKPINMFFEQYLHTLEKIYFAGGEPFIMDEFWEFLEILNKKKRYDITIIVNTNLSLLKYKNKSVLDYAPKWGNRFWLYPSIDEVDERAELIRCGTNWNNVETNLKTIRDADIITNPNITVSAMNVFRIPEIINRLIEIGIIGNKVKRNNNWNNFSIGILTDPPFLHLSSLPEDIRENAGKKLKNYLDTLENIHHVNIYSKFAELFDHLKKPQNIQNAFALRDFMKSLDEIRNENTFDVIPELKCIL